MHVFENHGLSQLVVIITVGPYPTPPTLSPLPASDSHLPDRCQAHVHARPTAPSPDARSPPPPLAKPRSLFKARSPLPPSVKPCSVPVPIPGLGATESRPRPSRVPGLGRDGDRVHGVCLCIHFALRRTLQGSY